MNAIDNAQLREAAWRALRSHGARRALFRPDRQRGERGMMLPNLVAEMIMVGRLTVRTGRVGSATQW